MLPNEDMARVLSAHRTTESERSARDRGFLEDTRLTPEAPPRRTPASPRRPDADCRPCPPPCPERAQGVLG